MPPEPTEQRRPASRVGPIVSSIIIALIIGGVLAWAIAIAQISVKLRGTAGVTVNAQGDPVLLVETCDADLNHMILDGRLPNDHEPARYDRIWSTSLAPTGLLEFPVAGPPPSQWTATGTPPKVRPDYIYIAIANNVTKHLQASQVSYYPTDLQRLTPGTVLIGNSGDGGKIVNRAEFETLQCRR